MAAWVGREHVRQVGRAERVVADDELRVVGLDHDPARQRAGRLGAEAAQGVEAVVGVRVDVARDEAGDEVLLRGADGMGGAVELARLGRGEADEQRGGVGGGGGAARRHISYDIKISDWHDPARPASDPARRRVGSASSGGVGSPGRAAALG